MKKLLAAITAICLLGAVNTAQETKPTQPADHPPIADHIKRQPNLSPDGKTVAFVYDGDIWVSATKGGYARRLTSTVDNEGSPKFSPDGKWLAYRSRRYGHDDVFVMPAEGGPGTRLTWADGYDDPCCWLPDSTGIVFESYRQDYGSDLHIVRLDGGEPWAITDGGYRDSEFDASISPDGKTIAYVRRGRSSAYRRRGYNGTANNDIWLADFDGISTSNHRAATFSRAHENSPIFVDNETFIYVSFADGKTKTSRQSHFAFGKVDGSKVSQTMQSMIDVREPTVVNGQVMFTTGHYGGWNLNLATLGGRKAITPEIKIASDDRSADMMHNTLTRVVEFEVSPDGKKVAFVSQNDVWVMALLKGASPRQITNTLHREKDIRWNTDSTQLIFSSRATGNFDVQIADVFTNEVRTVADTGSNCAFGQFVPGSDRIIFTEGSTRIRSTDYSGIESEIISDATFTGWNRYGGSAFEISSDGQWLLYERENENFDQDFWLLNLKTKKQTRSTFQFGNVSSAVFSHDGKRINFVCNQEDDFDVYAIELLEKELEFAEDKDVDVFKKPEPKKEDKKDDKSDDKKPVDENTDEKEVKKEEPKLPEIKIDLDSLMDRTSRITTMDGHEWSPVSVDDGKTTLFIGTSQGQTNIWKLTNEAGKGPNLKQLTTSRSKKEDLRIGPNGKNVWFKDGNRMAQMSTNGGKITYWDFKVIHSRSKRDLRLAAFDETTWAIESFFYDDKFHGQNWKHLAKTYRKALQSVGTGDEWGSIMNELFGELNSSHQGFYAKDNRSDGTSESVGWLGLRFDQRELARGLFKVSEVVKDGPCDREDVEIRAGDYLSQVDGTSITGKRLSKQLLWKVGKKVVLGITSGPDTKDLHMSSIKPITRSAWFELLYQRWVDKQREMVHKLSDGQLGYVHIRGMNDPSLRHFKHQIGNDMLGKKGVVIDVRFNGGGYTAVHVLEILVKKPWLKRTARGREGDVSENIYRSIALEKPSCLLINQDSFSNAEIMAEGFKRLKIGKVIGVETAGGVIGTSSYNLIDGSRMRMPVSGAFAVDGENLENNGRKPDISVDNTPNDINSGRDKQIEQAVKTLLAGSEVKGSVPEGD